MILSSTSNPAVWLIALAAPREFSAVATALGVTNPYSMWELIHTPKIGEIEIDLVWTGVGKSNAAGGVARVLDVDRHGGVLSAGIAGALPISGSHQSCSMLDVVCASESIFADEGVQTPDGFESCAQMGFAPFDHGTDSIAHDARTISLLDRVADVQGKIATVSVCSGTDRGAGEVVDRTSAICEAMEGAAVGLAARRIDSHILTGELRVISNTTGDRGAQIWDLDGAMGMLGKTIGRFAQGE